MILIVEYDLINKITKAYKVVFNIKEAIDYCNRKNKAICKKKIYGWIYK
jgi:hypothetical protein